MVTQAKRMKLDHPGVSFDKLSWDYPVQLIGEKVNDPDLLNCCMICCLPILIYGRMHPCKHVLCLDCAKKHCTSTCSKCGEKVTRIEQCELGTVFVCSYGSPRHGPGGCRRTYLSYRDMEAHVKHRHTKKDSSHAAISVQQPIVSIAQPPLNISKPPPQFMRPPNSNFPPPGHLVSHPPPSLAPSTNVPPPSIPVVSRTHPVHHVPPNIVSMPTGMPHISAGSMSRPGSGAVVLQRAPGIPMNSIHHRLPGHGIPPQPLMAGVPHSSAVHGPRHSRPPMQTAPIRPHNPPPSSSNLISIPLQGSTNDSQSYSGWQSGRPHSNNQRQQYNS